MKLKLFVVVLTLMLIVPTLAQEKVIGEKCGVKKILDLDEEAASIQLLSDKAKVVTLTSYLWDENYNQVNLIKLSENNEIYFFIDYYVTKATDVRFHYYWTGPEYYELTSDWYSSKRATGYYHYFYTNNNWQKGIYTLTVIAEQGSNASGGECVSTCRFRFY